jgi:hypothetical protein
MIGLRNMGPVNKWQWFDNFRNTYDTPDKRRTRALGFVLDGYKPEVDEEHPTRVALAAQWADPEYTDPTLEVPPLIDTYGYLCDVGTTVKSLEGSRVAIFRGIDPKTLEARKIEPTDRNFVVQLGTMAGDISWGLQRPIAKWYENNDIPPDATGLAFQAGIETYGFNQLGHRANGETTVRPSDRSDIPFYIGRVCLEPNREMYYRSRNVTKVQTIVFGNRNVSDVLANLERHADTLDLPIGAIVQLNDAPYEAA